MKNIIVNISKNDSNDIKFEMIEYFKLLFLLLLYIQL